MRLSSSALLACLLVAVSVLPVRAQLTCGEGREFCEAGCSPPRVAIYHGGSLRRCTASCEPRWQECLRTGIWVDLERRSSGGPEPASPF